LSLSSSPVTEPDTLHGSVHNHVFADHTTIVARLQRTVRSAALPRSIGTPREA
jgi:hypothetical protein